MSSPARWGGQGLVEFCRADVPLPELAPDKLNVWLVGVARGYDRQLGSLTFVFCSDAYLHRLNVEYLRHDTLTDIITFDLANSATDSIHAECYVSVARTRENAASFGVSPAEELRRVMAHGLLHLCGLGDKTEREQGIMRAAEQRALAAYA